MPYLLCQAGDIVFVRARVLVAAADAFQIRIEHFPEYAFTTWAPPSEIARFEDIPRLRPLRAFPEALTRP